MQTDAIVGRHQLGARLRQLRTARSLRLEDVTAKLDIVPSTLSRIENGLAPTKTAYLTVMLDLYGVDDPGEREHLTSLARAGQRQDWWADHRSLLPDGLGAYLGMETAAVRVRMYAAQIVPGVVQTPHYAEAASKAAWPRLNADEASAIATLQFRRQELLRQGGRSFQLVMDESALLRSVGSPQVMANQLAHLLHVSGDPSVTVRVIRLTSTLSVLSPSFTLLSLPGGADADIACWEGIGGQVIVTKRAADIRVMSGTFETLVSSALPPASSAELIRRHAKRMRERHSPGARDNQCDSD